MIVLVQDARELEQSHGGQLVEIHEIAHVDGIAPEPLAEERTRVVVEYERLERETLRRHPVELKIAVAQERIDVGEERLTFVEFDELNLRLDDQHLLQHLFAAAKRKQFRALNIQLEKIGSLHLGDVIETRGLDRVALRDARDLLETLEFCKELRIRLEQGGRHREIAFAKNPLRSVSQEIGQEALTVALLAPELFEFGLHRLESDDFARRRLDQIRVRQRAVPQVHGAHIHDLQSRQRRQKRSDGEQ